MQVRPNEHPQHQMLVLHCLYDNRFEWAQAPKALGTDEVFLVPAHTDIALIKLSTPTNSHPLENTNVEEALAAEK